MNMERLPTSNILSSKRVTLLVIASIIGIGCITVNWWLRSKQENDLRRRRRKSKLKRQTTDMTSAQFAIVQDYVKGQVNPMDKNDGFLIQEEVLDDLLVTMNQLESTIEYLTENNVLENNSEKIKSVQRDLEYLRNLLKNTLKDGGRKPRRSSLRRKRQSKDSEKTSDHVTWKDPAVELVDDNIDNESISSDGSFVSAVESIVDDKSYTQRLAEVDEELSVLIIQYGHLPFYSMGIDHYIKFGINVRKVRTEMLGCINDTDFKIKVHCIRGAFQLLLKNEKWRDWLLRLGRKMLAHLLVSTAHGDSVLSAVDDLVSYCKEEKNWVNIEEELKGRRVCEMSFYDIVLDFIVMDSFDDLEEPPSALVSVIQNGWIPNSVKLSALSTTVWSLLKAKTQMLKKRNAFLAKFYQVSQYLTPVLVWGFVGPEGELKVSCELFKESLLGYLRDIFSLDRANYDSIETLAGDVRDCMERRTPNEIKRLLVR